MNASKEECLKTAKAFKTVREEYLDGVMDCEDPRLVQIETFLDRAFKRLPVEASFAKKPVNLLPSEARKRKGKV